MKPVAAWLAEYNQILDTATAEQTTPEELEANLDAFCRRLAATPGDPLDKLEVLDGMMATMIAWIDRRIHRQTFEAIRAQQNRPSDSSN